MKKSIKDFFSKAVRALPSIRSAGEIYESGYAGGSVTRYPLAFQGWNDNGTGTFQQKAAQANSWVYSDVRILANVFSTAIPIVKDKEKILEEHPLLRTIDNPNPYMSKAFLMSYIMWSYALAGRCILLFLPQQEGNLNGPIEIWPLPVHMVSIESKEKEYITQYVLQLEGQGKKHYIDPFYVCDSRYPNYFDTKEGLAPLSALINAVKADGSQVEWNINFFSKNNAIPSSIISVPQDTDDSDFDNIKAEIFSFFTSGQRRTLITRAGDIDFKMMSYSPDEIGFSQGRQANKDEIDRVLGFPSGFWAKESNRANAQAAHEVMINYNVWPTLVLFASDITLLAKRWYGDSFVFAFKDMQVDGDLLEKITAYKDICTINELRLLAGFPPLTSRPEFDSDPLTIAFAMITGDIQQTNQEAIEKTKAKNAAAMQEKQSRINADLQSKVETLSATPQQKKTKKDTA